MKYFSFQIMIEKEDGDEGYYAYCPNLPGCFSNGRTFEETKANVREAVQLHLESLLANDEEIQSNGKLLHLEELTVGIPD